MPEFRVGVPRELTADQVAGLRLAGIIHDHESGPTAYAGFNDLEAMVTYVRLEAEDERSRRGRRLAKRSTSIR